MCALLSLVYLSAHVIYTVLGYTRTFSKLGHKWLDQDVTVCLSLLTDRLSRHGLWLRHMVGPRG